MEPNRQHFQKVKRMSLETCAEIELQSKSFNFHDASSSPFYASAILINTPQSRIRTNHTPTLYDISSKSVAHLAACQEQPGN
jgi:hypothetical protein